MKIKKMEDFEHDVEVTKEVLSSMPINNQRNLKTYKEKVNSIKEDLMLYENNLYITSNKYLFFSS